MSGHTSFVLATILLNLAWCAIARNTLEVRNVDHMKEHLPESLDLKNLKDEDLLFHYFRVHDSDGNNKLDGCELLQSVLHFHRETSENLGTPVRVFSDDVLGEMIDVVLESDDKNNDGFIDYSEFLSGQLSREL